MLFFYTFEGGAKMCAATYEELIAYLEEKISLNQANENEEQLYIDYIWNGKLNKNKYQKTYRELRKEMKEFYHKGFK